MLHNVWLCCMLFAASCSSRLPYDGTGVIPKIERADITIDGTLGDWEHVGRVWSISEFTSPWSADLIVPKTAFSCFADSTLFYFHFRVMDDRVTTVPFVEEIDVAEGDRVELFFSGDSLLYDYYCLEVNPYGHVLDYRAAYYRNFDEEWNFPGLQVATRITPDGYDVEGAIPLEFIRKLNPERATGDTLNFRLGVYRAEFTKPGQEENPVQWITWIDPHTEEPDFHVPSSLAKVSIP